MSLIELTKAERGRVLRTLLIHCMCLFSANACFVFNTFNAHIYFYSALQAHTYHFKAALQKMHVSTLQFTVINYQR